MALKVHLLNCATLCPSAGLQLLGLSPTLPCNCLLIESNAGLILVDTGLGLNDVRLRTSTPLLDAFARPRYQASETAYQHIVALGLNPDDVRHIVLTHLDIDHAGGLSDFPGAKVHLHAREHQSATGPWHWQQLRYQQRQWHHGVQWETYRPQGETWFGLEAVHHLRGLPEEIVLIPLCGHTHGHSGVAVHTSEGWLLHCGDACFQTGQIADPARATPFLSALQWAEAADPIRWGLNLWHLQQFRSKHPAIRVICSHEPIGSPP